ncbi:unnamed protein product [Strongylus vulgaris]|uniref:Uncharacterized protein n=1 Tax=Strongylus vulgaris TaxID=40348 RepID=A0A3P7J0A3_STRVU|nr:unnamed protein product [Strongylus vulgaris]
MPPQNGKAMSPEEARKLQDLCKEYDFGTDIGPEATGHSTTSTRELPDEAEQKIHHVPIKTPEIKKDLCKEYDFGTDIGPEATVTQQSFPISGQFSPPVIVPPIEQQGHSTASTRELPDEAEQKVHHVPIKTPEIQKHYAAHKDVRAPSYVSNVQ